MPVEIAKAVRKKVPVRLDALGTVTPIASVALKARVDTTIVGVHFQDGARVKKGDKLFTLDCRRMEAQIMKRIRRRVIDGDKAQLEQAPARREALHRSGRQQRNADRQSR